MKTIGEIKEEFSAAREADWNAICQMYETDLRSGVQKLVQQYRKKLDALEKEKLQLLYIILYKTEATFEYLNHTHDPAFAVHPCPSFIFCHQRDKSELLGATHNFLPRLAPGSEQDWLPADFTVHSEFTLSFCYMATFTGYFRYRRISPPSKQDTLWPCP